MLINLKHDGLQYEGGGGDRVQCLLRLSQPVDEVLQGVMEVCGQLQRFLQFDLLDMAHKSTGNKRLMLVQQRGGSGGRRLVVLSMTSIPPEEVSISGEADNEEESEQ